MPGAHSKGSSEAVRRFYAQFVCAQAHVTDARVIDAFASVKREAFVGLGPWHVRTALGYIVTETDDPVVLYQDILVSLAPDRRINNGQPSFHARCIAAGKPEAGEVVVHVGAGTGYYSAILAQLVGETGKVHAYEIAPDLATRATANLAALSNVVLNSQSALGTNLPAADMIYVCAGTTDIPAEWLDALAIGGRLVLPLCPDDRVGSILLVTRQAEKTYAARFVCPVAIIPCIGARDEEQSRAIAAALDAGRTKEVQSLKRSGEPDETAWCVGKGWWLSTAAP